MIDDVWMPQAESPRIASYPVVGGGQRHMNQSLRIAVADDEPDMQRYFEKILPRMGHKVVAVAANGRELVELCLAERPDLVITDIKMPEMDGIQAAEALYQQLRVPVILVSAYHDEQLVERAENDHVFAYLVKPIKQAQLGPAIGIAMHRFEQFQAVQNEASDLRQALADRKLIERAKGVMMKRSGLAEPDAFRALQKLASNKNLKLVEIARALLATDQAYDC